jgi:hypothetical protein
MSGGSDKGGRTYREIDGKAWEEIGDMGKECEE